MESSKIIPILLSGGSGTRLWPLSRESFPKQYQPINHNSIKSLLQITQERISSLENISNPMIICNEEHRFIVAQQMKEIDVEPSSIILEPSSRNTAPAITIAALKALETDDDPLLLYLAADHNIKDEKKFISTINQGVEYACDGRLVTFGILPTSPETGYGYIEAEKPFQNEIVEGFNIIRFIEKPSLKKAHQFIADKRFYWNSGIFLFRASVILKEIKKFNPEILKFCKKSLDKETQDLDFHRLDKESFESCEKISIDVAVMEKTSIGTVLPLNVGWNDIGSWEALWKDNLKDKNRNVIKGNVFSRESKDSYLRSESKLVVCMGIKNLIVVETNDALLVADKSYSEEIKNLVNDVEKKGHPEAKSHKKVYRPWGDFISIEKNNRWQIKKITVNPGASLSLQMHKHRSEHWIILNGKAKVELDKKDIFLTQNQSIDIPLGSKHRLSNPFKIPLVIIEVQSGDYLGEDDIIRFDDIYGRDR